MTISKELINQISEQVEQVNPNNRVKYLHLRKDVILEDASVNLVENFFLTLDEKTFNGKNYLSANFGDSITDHRINFDAVTVAYKQNENGDLDAVVVFKSPNDEYRKDVGRKLADTVLNLYVNSDNKVYHWCHTDHYGYHVALITISVADFAGDELAGIIPSHVLGKLTVSDLCNSLVTRELKSHVYTLISHVTFRSKEFMNFVPEYNFQ